MGQLPSLWRSARWFLGPNARWLLALPVMGVAAATAELVTLLSLVRSLLLLSSGDAETTVDLGVLQVDLTFRVVMVLAAGAALLSIVIRSLESALVGRLTSLATASARQRAYGSFLRAEWQEVAKRRVGHLQQLLGQNAQLISEVIPTLGTALAALLSLGVYGLVVLAAAPQVGLLFLVLGVLVSAVFSLLRRRVYATSIRSADAARELQLTAGALAAINREVHAFGVTGAAIDDLDHRNRTARRELRSLRTSQRLLPAVFIQAVLLLVVLVLFAAEALDIDGASFGAAAVLAVRSLSYLQQLNSSLQLSSEIRPYADEVRTFVEELDRLEPARGGRSLGRLDSIELRNVSFSYRDGEPALEGIDLRICAGEWIGIVGPSGSGKSTLLNVLAGLLRPGTGEHLVNGSPAESYSAESWRGRIALLSQEPALIRATVAENIAFFRPIPFDAIREAAELAAIAEEVQGLPDGFDTHVGDGAAGLSGGQRQRIALARAIAGRPDLLVLDEPTSALDAAKEQAIEQALQALDNRPIVVIASHRPALLQRCDRFYVIEHGRISERAREGLPS